MNLIIKKFNLFKGVTNVAILSLVMSMAVFGYNSYAASPLTCNLQYGTSFTATQTTTAIYQFNSATGIISALTSPTLPGRTRGAALSPDGNIISYFDDIDNRMEWYNFTTNTFGNGPAIVAPLTSGGMNRVGYAKNGKLYVLYTAAGATSLLEVNTTTYAVTNLGALTDKAGNAVSIGAISGGDLIFDDINKGYVIDNNGSFFKFDLTSKVATYLGDIAGVDATKTTAGLAYAANGDIYAFTNIAPNGDVLNIDLGTLSSTVIAEPTNGTVFADAFSCAFPDVKPKPTPLKDAYIVDSPNPNGTGGTVQSTPANVISPGAVVEYSVIMGNKGLTTMTNTRYQDTLPAGASYVAGSTTLNGTIIPGATFPYATATQVNSPGAGAGVTLPDTTPAVIDKEVVIKYRLKINDPFLLNPREIVNQGNFTNDDSDPVKTEDPTGGGSTDNKIGGIPAATPDQFEVIAGSTTPINLLANDSTTNGTPLTLSSINGVKITPGIAQSITVPNGVVNVDATGKTTFTPNPGYTGPITFPYSMTDGSGLVVASTVNIDVIQAKDDLNFTPINTPITYKPLSNDVLPKGAKITSVNGQPVTIGIPIPVTGGSITVNSDGTFTVTPDPGYTGDIIFPYEVTTPEGSVLSAKDTIKILVANDDQKETAIDTPITYDPTTNDNIPTGSKITDINGQPVIIGTPIIVSGGTVTVNADGTITVTPDSGSTDPIKFSYQVTTPDGAKLNATDIVTIISTTEDKAETPKDTPVTYAPIDNDTVPTGSTITSIDGKPVTVGTPIVVTGGTVTVNADGTVTVTPDVGFTGDIKFPYEVTTPLGTKISNTDTVSVVGLVDDKKETGKDTPITYSPLSNDTVPTGSSITSIDGKPVTIGTPIAVTGGTVTLNADGSVTVTPAPGFTGEIKFSYEVTTPTGTKVSATDTITIISAVNDGVETPKDVPISYSPLNNDTLPTGTKITSIDGKPVIVGTAIVVPDGTVTVNADGSVTVTPDPGFTGEIKFPYEVTTPSGTKISANDIVLIAGTVNENKETPKDTPVTYAPLANDAVPAGSTITMIDGKPVTIGTPIAVTGGTVTVNADGSVTVSPAPGFTGDIKFPYEVTTPTGTKVTATDTVTIIYITEDKKETPKNTPLTYSPLANDILPSGTIISSINDKSIIIGTPTVIPGGTVTINKDGSITINPEIGFVGEIKFAYEVTTPSGSKLIGPNVVIVVSNTPDVTSTILNTKISYNPLENDSVPSGSIISKINNKSVTVGTTLQLDGAVIIVNPDYTVTVTPNTGFTGEIKFPYEVTTPAGTKLITNDTLYVYGALNDNKVTKINMPITYNPLENDYFPSGTKITSLDGKPVKIGNPIDVKDGTIFINNDYTFTFTPNNGFIGKIDFNYELTFPNGNKTSAKNSITIDDVSIKANNDNAQTSANTPIRIDPIANDINIPSLSFISEINGITTTTFEEVKIKGGQVKILGDSSIMFTPEKGFAGLAEFEYTVQTPNLKTSKALVSINVGPESLTIPAIVDKITTLTPRTGAGENISILLVIALFVILNRKRFIKN